MGIQDRDYWRERYNNIDRNSDNSFGGSSSGVPLSGRRFRVIDEVRRRPPEPAETHSPERLLGWLTFISALIVVAFISYQVWIDRAEKQAQQVAAQQAMQASIAKAAQAKARAAAQAEQQARLQAEQLEQKKRLLEKLNKDAERKLQRDAAWERFYRPSAHCKADWTVDCANTLIRARKAFAAQQGD